MWKRSKCPVCQFESCERLLKIGFADGWLASWSCRSTLDLELKSQAYTILKCPRCHLYFQELVCHPEEEAKLYAGSKEELHGSNNSKSLTELAHMAEEAILIRSLFPDRRPKVLDFGMGPGHWAAMVRGYDCEVWGTDIDPRSDAAANKLGIAFVPAQKLPQEYFDFINADQVFEHLIYPDQVLRDLVCCLRSRGILKISTPGDKYIEQKINRANRGQYTETEFLSDFDALFPLLHLNLFARKSLHALGQYGGLSLFRIPLRLSYGTMTLFNSLRQWNRNLYQPFKRWRASGTWQFFKK